MDVRPLWQAIDIKPSEVIGTGSIMCKQTPAMLQWSIFLSLMIVNMKERVGSTTVTML